LNEETFITRTGMLLAGCAPRAKTTLFARGALGVPELSPRALAESATAWRGPGDFQPIKSE
jgi:hypothetical protein